MNETVKLNWSWSEIPEFSRLRREPPLLPQVVLPLLVTGGLWALGRTTLAYVVLSLGAVFLALRFLAPTAHGVLLNGLSGLGKLLGVALSLVLLYLIYFVVFFPVALLGRVLGRDPLSLKAQGQAKSYWMELAPEDPGLFYHQFLSEGLSVPSGRRLARGLRLGRVAIYGMATALILDFALGYLAHLARDALLAPPEGSSSSEVYRGAAWAREYWHEFHRTNRARFVPYLGWRYQDYVGEHINIRDGIRYTYQPYQPLASPGSQADRKRRVFVFGGSTIWGTGSRDTGTIPSALARLAEKDGLEVQVTNLGQSGYVTWQEVLLLSELCASGDIPDVAVFYDGANDTVATLETPDVRRPPQKLAQWEALYPKGPGALEVLKRAYIKHSLLQIVLRRIFPGMKRLAEDLETPNSGRLVSLISYTDEALASTIARTYLENLNHVEKLSREYGFKVLFFWQPLVWTKKRLTNEEAGYTTPAWAGGDRAGRVYLLVTRLTGAESKCIDLSRALDDTESTVFIDWAHVSEEANDLIARRIYPHLKALLNSEGTK